MKIINKKGLIIFGSISLSKLFSHIIRNLKSENVVKKPNKKPKITYQVNVLFLNKISFLLSVFLIIFSEKIEINKLKIHNGIIKIRPYITKKLKNKSAVRLFSKLIRIGDKIINSGNNTIKSKLSNVFRIMGLIFLIKTERLSINNLTLRNFFAIVNKRTLQNKIKTDKINTVRPPLRKIFPPILLKDTSKLGLATYKQTEVNTNHAKLIKKKRPDNFKQAKLVSEKSLTFLISSPPALLPACLGKVSF